MKYKIGDEFIEIADPNSGFIIEPVEYASGFVPRHCDYTHEKIEGHLYYGTHFWIDPSDRKKDLATSGVIFSESTLDKYFILRTTTSEVLFGNK